jgi:catechol 2,3-dioxygenase-like lactoylglutathione lyase family enzyme
MRCIGVRRNVVDLEKSAQFYAETLGFCLLSRSAEGADLRLGDTLLELRPANASLNASRVPLRSHDHSFRHLAIVVRDMAAAFQRILRSGVELISPSPQTLPTWNPTAGGIEALYFRDPSNHPLELIRFPGQKGKAIWHRSGQELFLGIDHTAIVVSDTEASWTFYAELGFERVAESHNYGPEQEALSGLQHASVRITSLGAEPLSLELLEYRSPNDGRSMPEDVDLRHLLWSETLIATSAPDLVPIRTIRDPDGYGVDIR